ncbi:MAG TPA: RNase adapter RapZ [Thermoanaerobaculales bacterium]|nr:RNase adapter RapZ [Thermoanaerobaculales bacterium]HQP44529.1 RNase adapter RapZ [Thermoanaerobaculales bacterium]
MAEQTYRGPFVITGLSGSGKTVLSRSLEDLGYVCVDNIPLEMVPELFSTSKAELEKLVVVVDVRTRGLTEKFAEIFSELSRMCSALRIVFVEATPIVLMRRFSIARRPHPLRDRSLEQAIADERASLMPVRELADLIIDTTHLTPHDLKRQILSLAGSTESAQRMLVAVESFSYLQGVPVTASVVLDVRFLPNPYFQDSLRSLPGDDGAVVEWFSRFPEVEEAISRLLDLLLYLLPRYAHELKAEVTIAVGCTGGRHRSVFVAERIGAAIREAGYEVAIHHRDRDRWR